MIIVVSDDAIVAIGAAEISSFRSATASFSCLSAFIVSVLCFFDNTIEEYMSATLRAGVLLIGADGVVV